MRHRVALLTMALGVMAAGSARAHDATQVIYDLTAHRSLQSSAPKASPSHDVTLPTTSLPISTPSLSGPDAGQGDIDVQQIQRPHGGLAANGVGSPRGGKDPQGTPNPTPEPGTMLLLGGALASGARYLRRRSNA
jgi:hypothetical protein